MLKTRSDAAVDTRSETVIRTLLVTDLVDSTRLMGELGGTRALDLARRHERVARDLLPRFNGREIDKADGFLILFERPIDAVSYALTYHRDLAELSTELEVDLRARAGIHLDEVILRQNDPDDVARGAKPLEVDGLAKPMAARLMSLACGRQTLLTRGAFDLARRAETGGDLESKELRWLAHGPYLFKGIGAPVEIFEVGEEKRAPLTVPRDSEKARRSVAAGDELTLGWRPGPGLSIPRRPGWLLEKRLSEGGFGEVWLARRKGTGERRVFKFCYEVAHLRALRREVTLFRLLKETLGQRDDIVRVLDWNFDRAPYYLEAEYSDEGDLDTWVEQQGGFDAVPMATRLELVAQVAGALAAAHSVGVLHKDVKPQNVLVSLDPEGRPKARLTDFGIGQVTDEKLLVARGITVAGLTELGSSASLASTTGTELYRAPELTEGKPASVQADVYALGVVLYQFVVGDFRHALAPGWRRDVADDLLAEDIAHFVDGSPQRRASSASQVADRLRSLQERRARRAAELRAREEAEQARRALERSHRRRRVFAALAAAAAAVLLLVSVLAVQAIEARKRAEQRREQAEELIAFMLGDLRKKLEPASNLEILRDIGDQALAYFASVPETELTTGEVARHSKALEQIGHVRIAEGDLPGAMEVFRESLDLARKLAQSDPENVQFQRELGTRHFWVGKVLWDQGDLEGALEQFRSQLAIAERLLGREPDNLDLQLYAAFAQNNLSFIHRARGDLQAALAAYRANLAIKRRVAEREPENSKRQLSLANQYNLVGWILLELGDLDGAQENFLADQAIAKAWVARDSENPGWQEQLAHSHNFVGRVLEIRGEHEAAWDQYQAHLKIAESLVARDPEQASWQRHLEVARNRIAEMLEARGDLPAALSQARQALDIAQSLAAKDPTRAGWLRDLAKCHVRVGEILAAAGDVEGARARAESALAILEPLMKERPDSRENRLQLSESCNLLASTLFRMKEPEAAKAAWRRAVETLAPIASDSYDVDLLRPWLEALAHLERKAEAERALRKLATIGVATAEPRASN